MMDANTANYELEEIKCVENYPDFEKLMHIIQHGLQGLIVKNIKGVKHHSLSVANVTNVFTKCTFQEVFEAVAQINQELKRTKFDGAFCKIFKLLVDRFSSFFNIEN